MEEVADRIIARLFEYSASLDEWAEMVAQTMLNRVAQADYDTWMKASEKISRATRQKLKDVGPTYSALQEQQVRLIKSLPLDAARKVHEWTERGLSTGERYADISERILGELGGVTRSRAILIARTETARARTNFTEARARNVGSTHYIWKTVGDGSVRPTHRRLNNTIQRWDSPPVCDYGRGKQPIHGNAGTSFNCRCFCLPLFPKDEME